MPGQEITLAGVHEPLTRSGETERVRRPRTGLGVAVAETAARNSSQASAPRTIHRVRLTRRRPSTPGRQEIQGLYLTYLFYCSSGNSSNRQRAAWQLQKKAPNTLKSLDAKLKSALLFRRRIASRLAARFAAEQDEAVAVTRLFLDVASVRNPSLRAKRSNRAAACNPLSGFEVAFAETAVPNRAGLRRRGRRLARTALFAAVAKWRGDGASRRTRSAP
jgi:hypothetical protein